MKTSLAITCVGLGALAGCVNNSPPQNPQPPARHATPTDYPRPAVGTREQEFAQENPHAVMLGVRTIGTHQVSMYRYRFRAPGDTLRTDMYYVFSDGELFQWDHHGRWPKPDELEGRAAPTQIIEQRGR